jgi:XTP/dITP diphosphohydrolase
MTRLITVVFASTNTGKLNELTSLLEDLPVQFVSIRDVLNEPFIVNEEGDSFEENAKLKAGAACNATRMVCLADDSGLEVDVLAGRPGVRSARFAHDRATDAENNAALLRELENIEDDARHARFRCVLGLASPWESEIRCAEGRSEGTIARTPRGSGGFGYDPLFIVEGHGGRVMAELSEQEKNRVSHRGRAVRALRPLLIELLNRELDVAERISG